MKRLFIGLMMLMGLTACNQQQRNAVDSVLRSEQHAKEVLEKLQKSALGTTIESDIAGTITKINEGKSSQVAILPK